MSLKTNKRLIAAKIESAYGTDPTPTGSNAILVRNLEAVPLEADTVSRDLIKPYLGISEQLLATKLTRFTFEVELVASGVIGKVPGFDALLRACGFTPTASTTSISAAIDSEVVTVTKTSHGLVSGDKIIPSGFTDAAANIAAGVTITKVDANTFTYPAPGAANDPTADGTPVYTTQLAYAPVSSSFESVAIYFNVDGVLHKALGCRGSVEFNISVKQIPTMKFTFLGTYSTPTDTAALTPDFSAFQTPYLPNTENTPTFTLDSYSAILESFSFNVSNQIEYKPLIGYEEILLVNRSPSGQLLFEAPTIAEKDFWTIIEDNTNVPLVMNHGPANGYKTNFSLPHCHLGNPTYQDSTGIQMLSVPFQSIPSSSGNDEISFVLK